jgi:catechol 2,3-dioxygenase-like lactoylglutathione lyase family enzyme
MSATQQNPERAMASAWHWVSIGTGDLEVALDFWVARLGFECVARVEGDDPVCGSTGDCLINT